MGFQISNGLDPSKVHQLQHQGNAVRSKSPESNKVHVLCYKMFGDSRSLSYLCLSLVLWSLGWVMNDGDDDYLKPS